MSFLNNVSAAIQSSEGSNPNQGVAQNTGNQNYNQNVNSDILNLLAGNMSTSAKEEPTPEEELQQLFTPTEKDHKDEVFDPNTLFSDINPEELQAAISQMNFTDGIFTPELAEQIASGGQEAVTAMAQAMNAMGQRVALQSFQVGTRMVTQGIAKAAPAWSQTASTNLRNTNITEAIKETDPIFNNPLTAPMVENLRNAIISKQPNATKEEVKAIATKMLGVIRGNQTNTKDNTESEENKPFDWDSWFKT